MNVTLKASIILKLAKKKITPVINALDTEFNEWIKPFNTPIEQIRQYQGEKLQLLCKHAYEKTPYWHEKFNALEIKPEDVRTVDDFINKIPLTTREIADEHVNEFVRNDIPEGTRTFYQYTSGSTGKNLTIKRTIDDTFTTINTKRVYEQAGVNKNGNILYLFPKESSAWKGEMILRAYFPNLQFMTPEQFENNLSKGKTSKLKDIEAVFTYTRLPVAIASRNPETIKDLDIKVMMLSGQKMNQTLLDNYHKFFPNANIQDTFSMIELGWQTIICPEGNMHFMEDLYYPEVLNLKNNDVGELYNTLLRPQTTLFMRYETGDLVQKITDCPCDHTGLSVKIKNRKKWQEEDKHWGMNEIMNSIDASSLACKHLLTERVCYYNNEAGITEKKYLMIEKPGNLDASLEEEIKKEIINNLQSKQTGGLGGNIYSKVGVWEFNIEIVPKGELTSKYNLMPGKAKIFTK